MLRTLFLHNNNTKKFVPIVKKKVHKIIREPFCFPYEIIFLIFLNIYMNLFRAFKQF